MEIKSILNDKRINAINILIEIPISEYVEFANNIIDKNEFQRKKVVKSKIKEILHADLLKGCLMPSIVLAISRNDTPKLSLEQLKDNAQEIVEASIKESNLVIVDGLQRTFTILEIIEELKQKGRQDDLDRILALTIRCEIYAGLNRNGLLYRMITLNTGQASMSTRHLMEILYLDYKFVAYPSIKLISNKDDAQIPNNSTEYSFKSMLDGFSSYLDRDENIFDRTEILQNIKNLDVYKEFDPSIDAFEQFISSMKLLIDQLDNKVSDWSYDKQTGDDYGYKISSAPFGTNIIDIFKKSQVMTGYGAALGFLRDNMKLTIDDTNDSIKKLSTNDVDWNRAFYYLIQHLDLIKNKSRKIGNDQRFYFKSFFKSLLNPNSETYLNFYNSLDVAFTETLREKLS